MIPLRADPSLRAWRERIERERPELLQPGPRRAKREAPQDSLPFEMPRGTRTETLDRLRKELPNGLRAQLARGAESQRPQRRRR